MSPLALRRYRAERLLRDEFTAMRSRVLASVRQRLAASGATLDDIDLDACYAQAWHGLYAAVLKGESIESPVGWLITVCFRRALDEHRARCLPTRRLLAEDELERGQAGADGDFAAELDERARLRQLLEGICATMSERERQAASLCVLQGLPRAEAARAMGIAPRRMERLMDGRGPAKPGVAAKLAALTDAIASGAFCEQRASSMRALALGMLDPQGERYRLAVLHQRSCPACRAYVLQLRGLAAALPPIALPGALLRGAGEGAGVWRRLVHALRGRRVPLAPAPAGAGGAAGVAGGGLGGGLGSLLGVKAATLAVAAVLASGSAVALLDSSGHSDAGAGATRQGAATTGAGAVAATTLDGQATAERLGQRYGQAGSGRRVHGASQLLARLTPSPQASLVLREFGFERGPVSAAQRGARRDPASHRRRRASAVTDQDAGRRSAGRRRSASPESAAPSGGAQPAAFERDAQPSAPPSPSSAASVIATSATAQRAAALREFGIE